MAMKNKQTFNDDIRVLKIRNCSKRELRKAGLSTLYLIAEKKKADLFLIPSIGVKTVQQIARHMRARGIRWE
jgi:DNA-directed RNA polymerase alpha subunit